MAARRVIIYNALRSSGTSPNFRNTVASLKSPVAGVTSATERDRADVALFPREGFSAHHRGVGIEAFRGLAGSYAVIAGNEWQRNVVRHLGHVPRSWPIECQPV
jgi:hypothetical protein